MTASKISFSLTDYLMTQSAPTTAPTTREYANTPMANHITTSFHSFSKQFDKQFVALHQVLKHDVKTIEHSMTVLRDNMARLLTVVESNERKLDALARRPPPVWQPRPQPPAPTPLRCHIAIMTNGSVYVQVAFNPVHVVQVVVSAAPVSVPAPVRKRRMNEVESLQLNAQSMRAIKKQR